MAPRPGAARLRPAGAGPGESAEAVFRIDGDTLSSVDRLLERAVEPGSSPSRRARLDRTRAARLTVTD
ncbi:hypothetical protein NKH77_54710 [Streptomyces sp. M19]